MPGARKGPSRWQNVSSDRHYLPYEQLIMIMYLKISISDFLTLFASRTRGPFYERAPAPLLFAARSPHPLPVHIRLTRTGR